MKKRLGSNAVLFLISNRVPGGVNRRTSKMIERDLMSAHDAWLTTQQIRCTKQTMPA